MEGEEKPKRRGRKPSTKKNRSVQHANNDQAEDQQTFDCDLCEKKFLKKRYMTGHRRRCAKKEKGAKTHICAECGKIFSRLSHLQRHQLHHAALASFECTLCDRSFVQRQHLERHFRSNAHIQKEKEMQQSMDASTEISDGVDLSPANLRPHKCHFCPKSFPTVWEMKRHWRTIHPYAVTKEPATGTNQRKETSTTTFLLKCNRCGVRFDNDLVYRNHLEWHSGRRRHKCEHCGFAFTSRVLLETHLASKHGVGWMFECVECRAQFALRSQIIRHVKNQHVHEQFSSGETSSNRSIGPRVDPVSLPVFGSFPCKYCGLEMGSVDSRRKHISTQHFRIIHVDTPVCSNTTRNNSTVSSKSTPSAQSVSTSSSIPSITNSTESPCSVRVVVTVEQPVSLLKLGPKLPQWLLDIQPSYSTLDVELEEMGERLDAGGNIVLNLPLPGPIPDGIENGTIRISYSDDE